MTDDKILLAVRDAEAAVDTFYSLGAKDTSTIRKSVRASVLPLYEDRDLRVTACEIVLTRSMALIAYNAEFRILKAYSFASPGLIIFLTAAYKFVVGIIRVITLVNQMMLIITGQNLAYWLNKLMPGFQDAWNDMMNKISDFSSALGWGVDGVQHLLNATNQGADLWGMVTGKELDTVKVEKFKRTEILLGSYSKYLTAWQNNPGEQIAKYAEAGSDRMYWGGYAKMHDITDKLGSFGETAKSALVGVGSIANELLSLRNDMPGFIAENIPSGIWNALEVADATINDRILPALTDINDRLEELDAVLESYQAKAAELAERLAHPGDLLAEIDKLPDYARQNQLVKIDAVTSTLMKESNDAAFAALEGDLSNFALVAAALQAPPPPLPFMQLELPGRSPGITPEPHESWILTSGDY